VKEEKGEGEGGKNEEKVEEIKRSEEKTDGEESVKEVEFESEEAKKLLENLAVCCATGDQNGCE